jgi:hypothetical protein
MSATEQRDRAGLIAGTDLDSALRIARGIDDPWFRCQAVALVAWRAADHGRFLGLVSESLESGWSIKNANRAVTVSFQYARSVNKGRARNSAERARSRRICCGAVSAPQKANAKAAKIASGVLITRSLIFRRFDARP